MLLRAALLFAALAAGCQSAMPPSNRCQDDRDCGEGEHCQGGICIDQPRACGASAPCPEPQHCCGGYCSFAACCLADFECPGGYCASGTCRTGQRPTCSAEIPCPTGRCLTAASQCVECLFSDDCASDQLYCSPGHTCLPAGTGCTAASCGAQGLVCGADGTCRPCVSAAECGDQICVAGACVPCTVPSSCGLGRVCDGGVCRLDPGVECTTNADCGELYCNPITDRCDQCLLDEECGPPAAFDCDEARGTCHARAPDCLADSDCAPPATICLTGLCSPGCTSGSCGTGQVCSPTTGRCQVVSTGSAPLGADCTAHGQCASGVCWAALDDGTPLLTCSKACMRHGDCPDDFVCYELGEGNFCVAKSRFPDLPLDVPPGGACSAEFINPHCTSGYCDTAAGACMEMCGRDQDCVALGAGAACILRWPVGVDLNNDQTLDPSELFGFTALCQAEPWGPYPPGELCPQAVDGTPIHEACSAGYCVQTPDLTLPPRCAEPCCTPHDCDPSRSICKPISVWDGIYQAGDPWAFQKVCLWREHAGGKLVGEACAADGECATEICVAGPSGVKRCSHTCCTDADCADYDWAGSCRTPFSGAHAVADANFEAIDDALGRQAYTPVGTFLAEGAGMLCLPR